MNWIDYRSAKPFRYQHKILKPLPESTIIYLSDQEKHDILQYALRVKSNPYIQGEEEDFIKSAIKIKNLLKADTLDKILAELEFGYGFVLIDNLPTDPDLPNTPTKCGALPPDYKTTFVAELLHIALGTLTGAEPYSFRQSGRGSSCFIENVVPIPDLKTQAGGGGFDDNFPFHCEVAFHRKRPDYLVLVGVREDKNAGTLVFPAKVLEGFTELGEMHDLKGKFRSKGPESFYNLEKRGMPMGVARTKEIVPVETDGPVIRVNVNLNGVECSDNDAIEWLDKLEAFIEKNSCGAVLGPENALLINNYLAIHTRTGYTPVFNQKERWFLRGYFKKDLWSMNGIPPSLDSMFDASEVEELHSMGWVKDGRLSEGFLKYVKFPEEFGKLTGREAILAEKAYHFTPIAGSRVV